MTIDNEKKISIFNKFIKYKKNHGNISEITLTHYKICFYKHLVKLDWESKLTLADFNNENLKKSTINLLITLIKNINNWYTKTYKKQLLNLTELERHKSIVYKKKPAYYGEILDRLNKNIEEFKNKEFKFLWHILLKNGCRLSEFTSVDWQTVFNRHFKIFKIETKKNNNDRFLSIPEEVLKLTNSNLDIKKLQNRIWIKSNFVKFKKFVFEKNEDIAKLNLQICAHSLRTTFITYAHKSGKTVAQIAQITGHKNLNTIQNHYINVDEEYQKDLLLSLQKTSFKNKISYPKKEYQLKTAKIFFELEMLENMINLYEIKLFKAKKVNKEIKDELDNIKEFINQIIKNKA
ncbi:tyrosine-type recombinase/integrase [Mycoplasma struthionis]|uniref:Site-specific integrase n=1 Tax=Mycoplasma struthionis TaxID=538220 RepID=A0A3G8LFR6_9MOLU|nr:site-specific integrase [Mycoplasma struthionis]AZG68469.1 site-specific integrase [Mycoplasma struthionis]TPI02634.1 site-specific integrase [Mycoplasma struthionis]